MVVVEARRRDSKSLSEPEEQCTRAQGSGVPSGAGSVSLGGEGEIRVDLRERTLPSTRFKVARFE